MTELTRVLDSIALLIDHLEVAVVLAPIFYAWQLFLDAIADAFFLTDGYPCCVALHPLMTMDSSVHSAAITCSGIGFNCF